MVLDGHTASNAPDPFLMSCSLTKQVLALRSTHPEARDAVRLCLRAGGLQTSQRELLRFWKETSACKNDVHCLPLARTTRRESGEIQPSCVLCGAHPAMLFVPRRAPFDLSETNLQLLSASRVPACFVSTLVSLTTCEDASYQFGERLLVHVEEHGANGRRIPYNLASRTRMCFLLDRHL